MLEHFSQFPCRFLPALQAIERLQAYDRYLGAFIFGSLARMEATDHSDCDVQVIVDKDNPCTNVNHPIIAGIKTTSDVQAKYACWSAIIDHILEPLGGRQPIAENNCECPICQHDLSIFTATRY